MLTGGVGITGDDGNDQLSCVEPRVRRLVSRQPGFWLRWSARYLAVDWQATTPGQSPGPYRSSGTLLVGRRPKVSEQHPPAPDSAGRAQRWSRRGKGIRNGRCLRESWLLPG